MSDYQDQDELLAGHALGDLNREEQAEWDSVFGSIDEQDIDEVESTAAILHLALASQAGLQAMPASLAAEVVAKLSEFFDAPVPPQSQRHESPSSSVPVAKSLGQDQAADLLRHPVQLQRSGMPVREMIAWFGFCAASLLCVALWLPGRNATGLALRDTEAREALIQNSKNLVQVAWSTGKTAFEQTVGGDVVWDNTQQVGYMLFDGLPINNPTEEQYQLWIIDPDRDDEPIDGGVFDISSAQDVIPIRPKLKVLKPTGFAVTIEKPGGVVVSTQDRLPLIAAVP